MTQRSQRRRQSAIAEEAPFEKVVEKLESLVAELEKGELPLEASLEAFEEGVALARRASSTLDKMERRIEILTQDGRLEQIAEPSDVDEDTENECE